MFVILFVVVVVDFSECIRPPVGWLCVEVPCRVLFIVHDVDADNDAVRNHDYGQIEPFTSDEIFRFDRRLRLSNIQANNNNDDRALHLRTRDVLLHLWANPLNWGLTPKKKSYLKTISLHLS